jgi:hypothetical protein
LSNFRTALPSNSEFVQHRRDSDFIVLDLDAMEVVSILSAVRILLVDDFEPWMYFVRSVL